jgi:serine/threonine-protein kinase
MPVSPFAAMTTRPSTPPAPPESIGRFRVVGEIGRGANGVVYAAHDPVLGRDVAIKATPLAASDRERERTEASFIKEARAVAGLSHAHIVTVFDAGRTETLAYIAMERLHGRDLHEYLHGGSRLGVRQAAALMARIADAVHYAHKRGLIHRDIKPSNIFLTRDMKPKVLDFGVAMPRTDRDSLHRPRLIGTPNYMSPEQAQGMALDARSDVFSLGTILYEMLTGRRAFDDPDPEVVLDRVIHAEPQPLARLRPEVPEELARIVRKAMAKDVGARYQTAGEFRNDLATFSGSRELPAPAAPRTPPATPRRQRRPAARNWGAGAALLVVAAAAAWLAHSARREPVAAPAAAGPRPPAAAPAAPAVARPQPTTKAAAAPTPAHGQLMLAIAPWGEVLVDGQSRGVSPPLTRLQLPPGSYSIEVRNGQLPPLKARIDVRPGQTQTLKHRF